MNAVVKEFDLCSFSTAESRWARFGPYYAMFPIDFAFDVINKYSNEGDYILDPFAGRCSSIYAGGVMGRHSLGVEITPVGWLYGTVKLGPADKACVLERLSEINSKRHYYRQAVERMPEFFRMCYCNRVLEFLLSARKNLDWRNSHIDATLMSVILVYLHGKLGEGLSNQMRMTKAMGPNYSVKWWRDNNLLVPPEIDPVEVIRKKIEWRYAKGTPEIFDSKVVYGDSSIELGNLIVNSDEQDIKFSLLFTSPPYYGVTDYHADQWLRLWLLGGPEYPEATGGDNKGRFGSRVGYEELLDKVFGDCASLMKTNSTVYVRTDKRSFTFETTLKVLKKYFPDHDLTVIDQPFKKKTQTYLHGNVSSEKGEVDIVLTRL